MIKPMLKYSPAMKVWICSHPDTIHIFVGIGGDHLTAFQNYQERSLYWLAPDPTCAGNYAKH